MHAPYRHLLLMIDGTADATAAVACAVRQAGRAGARLAIADVDAERRRSAERQARAEGAACAVGVTADLWTDANDVDTALKRAATAGCDLVIGPAGTLRSVGAPRGLAMLKVPTEPRAEADPVIARLDADHRRLADALQAVLLRFSRVETAMPGPTMPHEAPGDRDAAALLEAIDALQPDASAYHHRLKEDALFSRLRRRTSAWNGELDELERQHEREQLMLAGIGERAGAWSAAPAGKRDAEQLALGRQLLAFARFAWHHMGREEGVVWPAACCHLRASDWLEIAAALDAAATAPHRSRWRQDGVR